MTCYFGFENRTPRSSRTRSSFVAMAGSSV
jgi:hypothetical protein